MVEIDKRKLQEVRDYYHEKAEEEIEAAKLQGQELSESDEDVIRNKFSFQASQTIRKIQSSNPKRIFGNGFALDPNGWREGYTKQPLSKRVEKRRKKKKAARKARQAQRRK